MPNSLMSLGYSMDLTALHVKVKKNTSKVASALILNIRISLIHKMTELFHLDAPLRHSACFQTDGICFM